LDVNVFSIVGTSLPPDLIEGREPQPPVCVCQELTAIFVPKFRRNLFKEFFGFICKTDKEAAGFRMGDVEMHRSMSEGIGFVPVLPLGADSNRLSFRKNAFLIRALIRSNSRA
jgi:hypothetical protein